MELEDYRKLFPVGKKIVVKGYFTTSTSVVKEVRDDGYIVIGGLEIENHSFRNFDEGSLEKQIGTESLIHIRDLSNGSYKVRYDEEICYLEMQ